MKKFLFNRFLIEADQLKILVELGFNNEEILSWVDTKDLVAVKWMIMKGILELNNSFMIRNIRNPTNFSEVCMNNVGSFLCVSLEDEKIGIGWSGSTTATSTYTKEFDVVTADERTCMDHQIPDLTGNLQSSFSKKKFSDAMVTFYIDMHLYMKPMENVTNQSKIVVVQ